MKTFLVSSVKLAIAFAVFAALTGCQTEQEWPAVDSAAITAGREFLAVLETGEPAQFEEYLRSRTELDVSHWFDAEARKFIYDGESMRRFRPRLRSIMDIIALGDIEVLSSSQLDGWVILIFVPGRYLRDADRPEFYTDEWMRKYFACWFEKVDGRWRLGRNMCFAESDGPYPVDMARSREAQGTGLSVVVRR